MKSFYLAAITALVAGQALAQDQVAFTLKPGMVEIAQIAKPFTKVVVGDPEIAEVTTMTDRRLAITAKQEGFASILFFAEDNSLVGQVNVNVVPVSQFGRSQVRVLRGTAQGMSDQTYNCEKGGPCHPEPPQQPININVSTGPVITGEAVRAAKGKK